MLYVTLMNLLITFGTLLYDLNNVHLLCTELIKSPNDLLTEY